ncbi:hypothetical protein LY76DRAFT_206423 [Colletotrichum caudatum]|nr:hypothetical protein LY76DRAFT_206423 [Colletotrichum caudatum]
MEPGCTVSKHQTQAGQVGRLSEAESDKPPSECLCLYLCLFLFLSLSLTLHLYRILGSLVCAALVVGIVCEGGAAALKNREVEGKRNDGTGMPSDRVNKS